MNNEEGSFFANKNIPYYLKAGMVAVALHATMGYRKNLEGKETFNAMFFDYDSETNSREIKGNYNFTFDDANSVGKGNCLASVRQIETIYPSIIGLVDFDANTTSLTDEEIVEKLITASSKRFKLSSDGMVGNYEKYISNNFDDYVSKIKSYYPGIVSNSVLDNLKANFEVASGVKKKLTTQSEQGA